MTEKKFSPHSNLEQTDKLYMVGYARNGGISPETPCIGDRDEKAEKEMQTFDLSLMLDELELSVGACNLERHRRGDTRGGLTHQLSD